MPAERTPPADDALLAQPLLALTQRTLRAPAPIIAAALLLAVISAIVTISGLTFRTSRLDLLNPRSEYNRRWLAYLAEFGNRDDAVVVFRAAEQAELTRAIDDLASAARQQPQLFESVFHQRDLSRLKGKGLHYLPAGELEQVEALVKKTAAQFPAGGQPHDPLAQLTALNERLSHVGAPSPEQLAALEGQYARSAGTMLAILTSPPASNAAPASAGLRPPLAGSHFEPQYLLADGGRIGFVLLKLVSQPVDAAPNAAAIARLRELIRQAQTQHPQVWIGLTGMPVIEHDEMQASQFDMLWTSVVSMGLVFVLYLVSYGGLRHAILVNVLLVLGTSYAFGFVTIAVGHLNILSAAFSAVLIGLGIDFSIHYVASYLKLREQGLDEPDALLRTAEEVGPGVVTGGVTTAAAFFMAAMTDFIGVRELGLVAGGGILLCVAATVVVLPPLILLVDRRWPLRRVPTILPAGRWFQLPIEQPRLVMACAAGVTLALGLGAGALRYDHNLLNLQPRHLESADIERQLLTELDDSVWFAVSVCASREELQERKAHFEKLREVAKTEEIASLLPIASPEQAERIAAVCRQVAALPHMPPRVAAIDPTKLLEEVTRAQKLLQRERRNESAAAGVLGQLGAALGTLPAEELSRRLASGQIAINAQWSGLESLRPMIDPVPPRLDDIPRELTDRFVGKSGTHLLKVYARGNIWNMTEMESFVRAVESVDPRVTGHPIQTYYASRHMQQSYLWAGLYALGAVIVLLWIDFRSLAHALLAMVPLALGFVQMCGVLGWLDIPLNAANMIVLPLILGIGVDHGVHLVHLWRQQRGRFVLGDSTAVAILLTATTTTASFGALILARHQGLRSLGQVLTLGVTTCLASSIVFFPALLRWLSEGGGLESGVGRRELEVGGQTSEVGGRWTKDAGEVVVPVVQTQPSEQPSTTNLSTEYSVLSTPVAQPVDDAPRIAEEPIAIPPAPVTEEEIAALLDSALTPPMLRLAEMLSSDAAESIDEDQSAVLPRRRNLPRRSEAA
jgi:hopanoid biosynthesis associated RND transporter like protein HpnN